MGRREVRVREGGGVGGVGEWARGKGRDDWMGGTDWRIGETRTGTYCL